MRTEVEPERAEAWWEGASADERIQLCNLAEVVEMTREGLVLVFSQKGEDIYPVLRWEKQPTAAEENAAAERIERGVGHVDPEAWWARLIPSKRAFYWQLSNLLEKVDGDRVVEVRTTEHSARAKLVLRFKHPVGGRAETN